MAKRGASVLLGYEDEFISDKHSTVVNYTTNKIGGIPNWPIDGCKSPKCKLCGLSLPLLVQIYAPLDGSSYHRTLYIFACINPLCWNHQESWVCMRSQLIESRNSDTSMLGTDTALATMNWCEQADNWEDQENGNMIELCNNVASPPCVSLSSDEDLSWGSTNLNVHERNANREGGGLSAAQGGAVGRLVSPTATAEIERDESEVVSIDTPTAPLVNLAAILEQERYLPWEQLSGAQFAAFFVSVFEEESAASPLESRAEHIQELLNEYQRFGGGGEGEEPASKEVATLEKYERSLPAHGDKMFHQFVSRLQANPGHILRYGGLPLLLYPSQEVPTRCQHCQGPVTFELQILPTLIWRLRLNAADEALTVSGCHFEFGTALIYSCRRSCWAPGDVSREEHLLLQRERI